MRFRELPLEVSRSIVEETRRMERERGLKRGAAVQNLFRLDWEKKGGEWVGSGDVNVFPDDERR